MGAGTVEEIDVSFLHVFEHSGALPEQPLPAALATVNAANPEAHALLVALHAAAKALIDSGAMGTVDELASWNISLGGHISDTGNPSASIGIQRMPQGSVAAPAAPAAPVEATESQAAPEPEPEHTGF